MGSNNARSFLSDRIPAIALPQVHRTSMSRMNAIKSAVSWDVGAACCCDFLSVSKVQ